MFDDVFEVEGLGKGLGSIGAKISKSAGMPGMDVGSNVKAVQPQQQAGAEQAPEEEVVDEGPEVVEELPDPVDIEYDKLGAPDKTKLKGHIVRRSGKEYVLDWDSDFEVYKLVEPETLRVRTRIKPASVSTVDFRAGTIREAVAEAIDHILVGETVDSLVGKLLDG